MRRERRSLKAFDNRTSRVVAAMSRNKNRVVCKCQGESAGRPRQARQAGQGIHKELPLAVPSRALSVTSVQAASPSGSSRVLPSALRHQLTCDGRPQVL